MGKSLVIAVKSSTKNVTTKLADVHVSKANLHMAVT